MIAADTRAGSGPVLCIVGARPNFMKRTPMARRFIGRREAVEA